MNFLEAHKTLTAFSGGPRLDFLLATSGAVDKLEVFLRAAAAKKGRAAHVRTLPFNTLAQALLSAATPGEQEIIFLFPWDFVPEADWRSGVPSRAADVTALRDRARMFVERLRRRPSARFFYVPAPLPPLFADSASNDDLRLWLSDVAASLGARMLSSEVFSLGSYLSTGTPFAGSRLGEIATAAIDCVLQESREAAKVLVTDLDNVLWHGVIGEDGVDGIRFGSEGVGYKHFLYQTLLAKLKREGTLLAAVTRNDPELAHAPFKAGTMPLAIDDFVVIVASYKAKSSQIREIAARLNLGLDSFVFVDDNSLEIEEVSAALPQVRSILFPATDDALPQFFDKVSRNFSRQVLTVEDADRTALYRRRLEGMVPDSADGADLTGFLRGLEMSMVIHDRSQGDRARAVQLINKTNQFNLNGRRITDDEVAAILADGGRLYGASLSDRTGSHGEVLACLVDSEGVVRSLVMSCRVFQRRLEHAFLAWLAGEDRPPVALEFAPTPRNEPIQVFLDDPSFMRGDEGGHVGLDGAGFASRHADDLALFALTPPNVMVP
ncbi:MAG TPA: HAD-IIIC family phosphatase [Gemmatimonadaceae bacterium]|nr:HAD-IIIC family phosphatase [Gemmatimonadaceae bacterium]